MFVNRCTIRQQLAINTTTIHNNMRNIFAGTIVTSFSYNVSKDEYWINSTLCSFSLKLVPTNDGNTILNIDSYVGNNQRNIHKILQLITSFKYF